MTPNRPGRGVYVTNTTQSAALEHGQPVKEGRFVGVAVKQKAPGWDSVVADATVIEDDEEYFLIVKGKVLVDNVSGFAVGDDVYIESDNDLTEVVTGNTRFGTVTEEPGDRGTPAGKCWIDLDIKY